mmetsp:Transcript_8696/g.17810  ORF Transcript_8696/g.17810 Transcript_8696/m.17810 type:complete len:82 (+) Transcript_8696:57-302(+)
MITNVQRIIQKEHSIGTTTSKFHHRASKKKHTKRTDQCRKCKCVVVFRVRRGVGVSASGVSTSDVSDTCSDAVPDGTIIVG